MPRSPLALMKRTGSTQHFDYTALLNYNSECPWASYPSDGVVLSDTRYDAYTLGATIMPQALVNVLSAQVGAPTLRPVIARGSALRDAADRMFELSAARG